MAKSDSWENSILALLFTATALANVADNAASAPTTSIFYSLHTADPLDAGDQSTSEAVYGSYARQGVTRSGAGHTVTANSVSPDANIDFPEATSGSETETHFIAGKLVTTAGVSFYHGTVTPNIVVVTGVTPRLTTATAITES